MTSSLVRAIDRRFYPQFGDEWDSKLFRELVNQYLRPGSAILDFGAGVGSAQQLDMRGPSRSVAGVDVDPAVLRNPFLTEARVLENGRIPFEANRFDCVVAHNVLEHVPDPLLAFSEIHRVLKHGGVFLAKTGNTLHYVPLIARLTPHAFHVWINERRGRPETDTFPTVYRVNTVSAIGSFARRSGFHVERIQLVEGRPEYLRINPILYLAGVLYERVVNATDALSAFRVVMMSVLKKP
jgi:SAM-dependent methyltransferase